MEVVPYKEGRCLY